jgi:hypothetical protein
MWSMQRLFARQMSGNTPLQQQGKRCFLCCEVRAEEL